MPPFDEPGPRAAPRSALASGLLLGIGLMGALDEILFHQLLQWHHFYGDTTPFWRIASDGLFHAGTTTLLLVGALRLWRHRRLLAVVRRWPPLGGGLLVGMGAFQLFDGLVNHKLLELHPVREGVERLLPYDLAWNAPGVVLLTAGWLVWRRRDEAPRRAEPGAGAVDPAPRASTAGRSR